MTSDDVEALGPTPQGNDESMAAGGNSQTSRVIETKAGLRLNLQKTALQAAGLDVSRLQDSQERIVELTLRSLSRPEQGEKRYFGRLEASRGNLALDMNGVGAKAGDVFVLPKARRYTAGDFVGDFSGHRGKETMNVDLRLDGGTMTVEVDGWVFQVRKYSLAAHTRRLLLATEMEGVRQEVRYWLEDDVVVPKLGTSFWIESFSGSESGLAIRTYMMLSEKWAGSSAHSKRAKVSREELSERYGVQP